MSKSNGVIFKEDFKNGLENWTTKSTVMLGKWIAENGELVYMNTSDVALNRGILCTKKQFYGFKSAKFEIMVDDSDSVNGCWFSRSFMQTYQVNIIINSGTVKVTYAKNDMAKKSLDVYATGDADGTLEFGKWNTVSVEVIGQRVLIKLNGKTVIDHLDGEYEPQTGEFLLKTMSNYGKFRNLTVEAEYTVDPPADFEEIPDGEPTKYIMDFREDKKPYGFTEPPQNALWNITELDGKKVYGTGNRDGFTHTWLHAFEKDGETAATVAVFDPKHNANFGIFSRFAVEGSYLKAGYDFLNNRWFIRAKSGYCFEEQSFYSDKSVLYTAKYYELKLKYYQGNATLFVNGEPRVTATELHNKMYGRTGLFAENTDLYAEKFSADFDHGVKVTDGVIEQTVCPDKLQSHLEIERVDENTIFGVFTDRTFVSRDLGLHFETEPEEYHIEKFGHVYPSILKMRRGGYIQIIAARGFMVQYSDDCKDWTDIGTIFTKERMTDDKGHQLALVHDSTMTEVELPDGTVRIFCPVGFRNFRENTVYGHNTAVFYSDDRGKSWTESKTDMRHLPGTNWIGNASWCESKVMKCSDGTLRMYCTRNMEQYVYYAESYDYGVTWEKYGVKKDMPCSHSSYAICEDPVKAGRYFMLYVKDRPYTLTNTLARRRIVLCVTENGKDFKELMDIDRFSIPEGGPSGDLYQILDPSITVCEDYIFIGYGRSDQLGGKASTFHNGQRIRFTRIDRKKANI